MTGQRFPAKRSSVDPIVAEVVRGALSAITEEMGLAVVRAAYSTRVKEGGDVSAAVFDGAGRLVAQSESTVISHVTSLRASLAAVLEWFPAEVMQDGDVYITNDPYLGGVHANDMNLFRPVFIDGRVAFFSGSLTHVGDVGGIAPGGVSGTCTDLFQEGIVLRPARLYRAGEPERTVFDFIEANSRAPERTVGDVKALVGAVNLGGVRMHGLHERLVRESAVELAAVTADLMDYAERRTRQAIARLRRGACQGIGYVDDDGVVLGKSYTVRVRVEAVGDTLTVDFEGTDGQAAGPINASRSQATSAAIYGVRMFLDIPDVPLNEGSFRPVRIALPERTVVDPAWPAPVSGRAATMMAIVEAMFEALAEQQPDRAVAESSINHVLGIASVERDTGRSRTISLNEYGGVGARCSMDGVDAHGAALFGGRSFTVPVEALEQEHPIRCRSFKLRADSGGAGRWRGGLGVERTVEVLEDVSVSMRTDKQTIPPRGRNGGMDGAGAAWVLRRADGTTQHLRSKETNIPLRAGDTITMLSSGGGGFGPPAERPAHLVQADVAARKVSLEAARDIYGVEVNVEVNGD